jgi:hypothetical protein
MRDQWHPGRQDVRGANRHADPAVPSIAGDRAPTWRRRERLSDGAKALMNALPAGVPVTALALDFPHVLNRIATLWSDADALEAYMWELLLDDRADREGFPFAVEDELNALQAHRSGGTA